MNTPPPSVLASLLPTRLFRKASAPRRCTYSPPPRKLATLVVTSDRASSASAKLPTYTPAPRSAPQLLTALSVATSVDALTYTPPPSKLELQPETADVSSTMRELSCKPTTSTHVVSTGRGYSTCATTRRVPLHKRSRQIPPRRR